MILHIKNVGGIFKGFWVILPPCRVFREPGATRRSVICQNNYETCLATYQFSRFWKTSFKIIVIQRFPDILATTTDVPRTVRAVQRWFFFFWTIIEPGLQHINLHDFANQECWINIKRCLDTLVPTPSWMFRECTQGSDHIAINYETWLTTSCTIRGFCRSYQSLYKLLLVKTKFFFSIWDSMSLERSSKPQIIEAQLRFAKVGTLAVIR